ncbi:MAG: hydroxymethylglutaryl-CoA lyase [Bacteroidetes bacterium]|nr:hydroxymethylglutaryl-CoA lyase [Bacteroidota bacterium]
MRENKKITLVECPRDAMQGLHDFIPTANKVAYLNALLKVGFDILDCVSFVSPKAIPQLADSAEVLQQLDTSESATKLLAIVANIKGAEMAAEFEAISYIGFPFSISETFQQRNTKAGIAQSFENLKEIKEITERNNKQLVVYISMGFGNPYGDAWSAALTAEWAGKLDTLAPATISIADTVGIATAAQVSDVFSAVQKVNANAEIGAHLHCTTTNWEGKLRAAYNQGCRRFDSALLGFGGCPFAEDKLIGNLSTENLVKFIEDNNATTALNYFEFEKARQMAIFTFN